MSVHITNTIRAGLFSLDEGLINAESFESDGNLSEKNVIRENTITHISEDHVCIDILEDHAIKITSKDQDRNIVLEGRSSPNTWKITDEDHDRNIIPEGRSSPNTWKITDEDHDRNIVSEGRSSPNTWKITDEDHDRNIVLEGQASPNTYNNTDEDHDRNIVPEGQDSPNAYNNTDEDHDRNIAPEGQASPNTYNITSEDHDRNIVPEGQASSNTYITSEDHDRNIVPEGQASPNTYKITSEDNDRNIVPEGQASPNTYITSEDHDRNIVPEGQASPNTYKIASEDHDRNIVPECQASSTIYNITDEEDFSFPFMKLFSRTRNKRKTKDKYKYQKIISDKANKTFIDPFRQTQRSVLSMKYEHGAVPNHPYIHTQSNSSVDNSSGTGASIDTLTQSQKVNSVNVNAKIPLVEEVLRQQHLENCKDVALAHGSHIHADQYDFSHPHRGYAIIIVNKYFERLYPRNGAEVDVEKTRKILQKLGYFNKNTERLNLDKETTLAILRDARNADHSNMDSFALIISSHGNEIENAKNGKKEHAIYCSDDRYIFTGDILEMFNDENCPSLKGKPKLFFIQACRGTNVDCGAEIGIFVDDAKQLNRAGHVSGVRSHHDGKHIDKEAIEDIMSSKSEAKLILACHKNLDETDARGFLDSSEDKPVVHCNNDCLVMYGIPSGHYAWRSNDDGSWMLHYLWEEVMKYDYQKPCSLLKMLTAVNRKMADRETNVPDNPEKTGKKAIPVIIHQLDKDIVFQQKQIK